MSKKVYLGIFAVLAISLVVGSISVEAQGDPVVINWYVGLGTGGNAEQIDAQNQIVENFNASHDNIELVLEIVDNEIAYDTLKTKMAAGDAPDIVGPVGIRGANTFPGVWLDLQPLVDASGYDLSQYPDSLVDFYREADGLVGLPFAVFPQVIYYNRDLFDEAGLDYPPHAFGEAYADGEPWDFAKARELAMILTVDANGNDANSPDFDPDNIVQFGFAEQWLGDTRRLATMFGSGSIIDENGQAQMPENWRASLQWTFDGQWVDHFIPNSDQEGSDLLAAGNPFDSGNVAMAQTFLWYTCCIANVENWDMAVVPSYNDVYTAALHADTFRIMNTTEHPEEAFEVLSYFLGEGSGDLLQAYAALPAREEERESFFANLDEQYPQGVDWNVVIESLAYPDIPSHEASMPNIAEADARLAQFSSLFRTDGSIDMDAEIETLLADLQAIFDAAPAE
jgi:multiple sugar transport system substrate-binding protein